MRFRESTPSLTSYACLETRSLLPRFGNVSSARGDVLEIGLGPRRELSPL